MTEREEKRAKLNDLAARIQDSKKSCENAYQEWCRAAEHTRQLEREFDDIARAM
jgi:hypothetical protein